MASCLLSLSNRKWPPLRCCCRLKAHRLARCLNPPFWSLWTESRQQRRETRKGGHGAEVRDTEVVVMAKEHRGKMAGRKKDLEHRDLSFSLCPHQRYERCGWQAWLLPWRNYLKMSIKPSTFLNTLFENWGVGLKETEAICIPHINSVRDSVN